MPNISDNKPAFDPSIQTEDIAFRPEEMLACQGCLRMNPPTRLKCLYCGGGLKIKAENAANVKPILRKLEAWERGCNVIVRETVGQIDIAKVATFLSCEAENIRPILEAGTQLPIARVESEAEANLLIVGLGKLGIKCSMLADTDLDPDKLPIRLSGFEFRDSGIAVTDFNTRKMIEIAAVDLVLIVTGLITSSKVDSLEKKRRGGKTKLLNETSTAADESVIDIYRRGDPVGFRVHLAGFDFSGLGPDKGILAAENMRRLVIALKENAPDAKLVADYAKVRQALGGVWEVEARKDPQGLQRAGFGKVEFGSVASTSNLRQFTKYSRLQWHLL